LNEIIFYQERFFTYSPSLLRALIERKKRGKERGMEGGREGVRREMVRGREGEREREREREREKERKREREGGREGGREGVSNLHPSLYCLKYIYPNMYVKKGSKTQTFPPLLKRETERQYFISTL